MFGLLFVMFYPVILSCVTFLLVSHDDKLDFAERLIRRSSKSYWISAFWWFPMMFYIPYAARKGWLEKRLYDLDN